LLRISFRLVVLSLAAAAFVALTASVGDSVRISAPNARWQAERQHRQSTPQARKVDEFVGAGALVALWALAGRVAFRLRLSPQSPGQEDAILLGLHGDVTTTKS
jgi:hypothetical protein